MATILLFILLSATADADPNNPLAIGIPISINDFSIATIADQLNINFYVPQPGNCNIVTLCINMVANVFFGIWDNVFSALKVIGGIPAIMILTFSTLFLFNTWGVFQGHIFLVSMGAMLTVLLLGSFILWIVDRITGVLSSLPIPFAG